MSTTPSVQRANTNLFANPDESIAFLTKVYPVGPWCLSAISPDKTGMETRTFWPDDPVPDVNYDTSEAGCRAWLEQHAGRWNLYWHVNPVAQLMTKKAERADIARVVMFHVDIDAKADFKVVPLKKQLDDILDRLLDNPPKGVPHPSAVLFSGGGYQAFWFIVESEWMEINGDVSRAEEAKLYNQWLEQAFHADNCHNIDRLMRLPGSINIPDAKKRARGREPALATVVFCKPELQYRLGDFRRAAPKVEVAKAIDVTNVRRLANADALDEWKVSDRVKAIVVQGHLEPKEGDNSRSAWLFDAVCNMLRAGVPDDMVYSVITDPNFGIAESVLEKGRQSHRYALKQIASGKAFIDEPWLAKLNDQYFVVRLGNKVMVGFYEDVVVGMREDTRQPITRRQLAFISPDEFAKLYENVKIEVGQNAKGSPIYKKAGAWWREHEARRSYGKLVFRPDVDDDDVNGDLNLWSGYSVEPTYGDRHAPLIEFYKTVFCQNDPIKWNYLWRWMALKVQRPEMVMQVAVVVTGLKGTGKTFGAETFAGLFGRHGLTISDPNHFVGRFTGLLLECCVLVSDEAFFPGDKVHLSTLKTRITGTTLTHEMKGVDANVIPNKLGVFMLSNDPHIIPATEDERRYFVLRASDEHRNDQPFFADLAKVLHEGGLSDFLGALLSEDLSDFQVRAVPNTAELGEQQKLTEFTPLREQLEQVLGGFDHGAVQTIELLAVLGLQHKATDKAFLGELARTLAAMGWKRGTCRVRYMVDGGDEYTREPNTFWHRRGVGNYRLSVMVPAMDGQLGVLKYECDEYSKFLEGLWLFRNRVIARARHQNTLKIELSDGKPTIKWET